jgi:hypothetical protein
VHLTCSARGGRAFALQAMARLLGLRRAWSVPGRLLDALPTGGLSNMDPSAGMRCLGNGLFLGCSVQTAGTFMPFPHGGVQPSNRSSLARVDDGTTAARARSTPIGPVDTAQGRHDSCLSRMVE